MKLRRGVVQVGACAAARILYEVATRIVKRGQIPDIAGASDAYADDVVLRHDDGEIEIPVPRDRAGTFEPQLIPKGQTRFDGFDGKILSLYARGMTVARSKATSPGLMGPMSRPA